jgi:hypothetical protein
MEGIDGVLPCDEIDGRLQWACGEATDDREARRRDRK